MTILRALEQFREVAAPLAMRPDDPPGDAVSVEQRVSDGLAVAGVQALARDDPPRCAPKSL